MNVRMPLDSRHRNALILALKKAMEALFNEADWKELGYATNTIDWISNHLRLLRSLKWGDPDYGDHVLEAIENILGQDPANLQVLLGFDGLADWIRENEPTIYNEVFGSTLPTVANISDVQEAARGFDIEAHIKRIRDALPDDPEQAIGSTKELIETVLKTILGLHGATIGNDDMPKLLKRVQAALGLDPRDIDNTMPGSDSFRHLLGNLAQVVYSVSELRNLYGTGHGKSNAPGLDPASARLVVGAGTTLAAYLMDRYNALKD